MSFDICEIYKGRKYLGVLPCKYFKKTELNDEYYLISNKYDIKPGCIIKINKKEKFYVADVRQHYRDDKRIEVFFETVAQHKEKIEAKTIAKLSIVISILAFVASVFSIILDL